MITTDLGPGGRHDSHERIPRLNFEDVFMAPGADMPAATRTCMRNSRPLFTDTTSLFAYDLSHDIQYSDWAHMAGATSSCGWCNRCSHTLVCEILGLFSRIVRVFLHMTSPTLCIPQVQPQNCLKLASHVIFSKFNLLNALKWLVQQHPKSCACKLSQRWSRSQYP